MSLFPCLSFSSLPPLWFSCFTFFLFLSLFYINTWIVTLNMRFYRGPSWAAKKSWFPIGSPQSSHACTHTHTHQPSLSFSSILFSNTLARWMPSHTHLSASTAVLYYLILTARSRPSCRCTAADVSPRDSLGEASAEPNRKVLNVRCSSNANLL